MIETKMFKFVSINSQIEFFIEQDVRVTLFESIGQMDQQSIVLHLARKGLAAVAIYEDLVVTLAAEAINYPSVTCYLREAKFATSNQEVAFCEPIPEHDDCHQATLLA
jgi:hypothetical protein